MPRSTSPDPAQQTQASGAPRPVSSGLWDHLRASTPMGWVLSGFALSYISFFLRPVFFTGRKMLVTQVVPVMEHLGTDLDQTLLAVHRFFDFGQTPYVGAMLFPPLTYVLFRPLQWLPDALAYQILSTLTILAYACATILFPLLVSREKPLPPALVLVAATGFVSYGLQFELERGQFNVIAACLAYLAIWIFHAHPSRRLWAYVLFSLSVQLKLYPLVFVLMLVGDWRDWKDNLRRFALLGLANIVLFFSLGPALFLDFLRAVWADQAGPEMVGFVNHSIHSFVNLVVADAAGSGRPLPGPSAGIATFVLYAIVGLCLLLIVLEAVRERSTGLNPDLLMACALAALLLPGESNDYKLTILAGPVAIFLSSLTQRGYPRAGRIIWRVAILLFSLAYSSTLFSFTYKPPVLMLEDLFPALLVMLLSATLIVLWPGRRPESAPGSETGP